MQFRERMLSRKLYKVQKMRTMITEWIILRTKIVIVISRLLKLYLKAKCTRAPVYYRALRRKKEFFYKGWSREAQVRFPEGQKGTE